MQEKNQNYSSSFKDIFSNFNKTNYSNTKINLDFSRKFSELPPSFHAEEIKLSLNQVLMHSIALLEAQYDVVPCLYIVGSREYEKHLKEKNTWETLVSKRKGRSYFYTPARTPSLNFMEGLSDFLTSGKLENSISHSDIKIYINIIKEMFENGPAEYQICPSRFSKPILKDLEIESFLLKSLNEMIKYGVKRKILFRDLFRFLKNPPKPEEKAENFKRRHELAHWLRDFSGDGTYARFFDRDRMVEVDDCDTFLFDTNGLSHNLLLRRLLTKSTLVFLRDQLRKSPERVKIVVFTESIDFIKEKDYDFYEDIFFILDNEKTIFIFGFGDNLKSQIIVR